MVQHAQVLLEKLGAMPTQPKTPLVRLVLRRLLELYATLVRKARELLHRIATATRLHRRPRLARASIPEAPLVRLAPRRLQEASGQWGGPLVLYAQGRLAGTTAKQRGTPRARQVPSWRWEL